MFTLRSFELKERNSQKAPTSRRSNEKNVKFSKIF
jgi:hypothetical protein